MEINFISSKSYSDETRTMRKKSNNVEIMMGSETEEVVEESMRGSDIIFDAVNAMYYGLITISLSRGGPDIDSRE